MTANFDCRQCGLPHAPDRRQLCGVCDQARLAEEHARNVKRERNATHKQRQEFAAMFGGNRHMRRRQIAVSKGR